MEAMYLSASGKFIVYYPPPLNGDLDIFCAQIGFTRLYTEERSHNHFNMLMLILTTDNQVKEKTMPPSPYGLLLFISKEKHSDQKYI